MKKEIITPAGAPAPVGPYSPAVKYGNLLFVSGQTGDPGTSVAEQTTAAMNIIKGILEDAGTCCDNILKTTIYISRGEIFQEMNAAYGAFFTKGQYPARICTYGAELYGGLDVEIEVIAAID